MNRKIKFGICADLHVSLSVDAEKRLAEFIEASRRENVDFIIQLGDFVRPDAEGNMTCKDYSSKENIINMFKNFEKPSFHVLGNHDADVCTKKEVLEYWGSKNGEFYSFDMGGFHFVVLDGNYMKLDGEFVSFNKGNYYAESYRPDRVLPYVSGKQLEWLEADLNKTELPSVLFSHQRFAPGNSSILNWEDMKKIIDNAPNKVLMSINGHEHFDDAEKLDGVWYYNMNSISNYWLGRDFPNTDRYPTEIYEKYPNIKYTLPYTNAAYGIITMDENGAAVKGTKGEFIGISPEEQGCYNEGSYLVEMLNGKKLTASVKDRYMEF